MAVTKPDLTRLDAVVAPSVVVELIKAGISVALVRTSLMENAPELLSKWDQAVTLARAEQEG